MFPRVTHPSATDILLCPFDLHVLSLPPAFALSQDQTLKLDLNFEPADHIVLTRSHHIMPTAIHIAAVTLSSLKAWCNLCIKTCTAEVFRPAPIPQSPACAECFRTETRKDSAVHVSLSSSKLVKQPDVETSPSPKGEKIFSDRSTWKSSGWVPKNTSAPQGAHL